MERIKSYFIIAIFAVFLLSVGAYNSGPDSCNKIDSLAVNGLLGTRNRLAYKVHEIEKHLHGREYWFGKSAGDTYLDPAALTEWQVAAGTSEAYGTAI